MKPKKRLGQNFLQDLDVIRNMVDALSIANGDIVVEIGGGKGVLTKEIVKHADKFTKFDVYEIDKDLLDILNICMKDTSNSNIVHGNFLDMDLNEYKQKWKVIGSIPYYISSPIIHKLLGLRNRPATIVLLIQKEVADKMLAKAPRSSYWSYIALGYDVDRIANVLPSAFSPAPKVHSTIIKFTKNVEEEKILREIGFKRWEKFLHRGYKYPRKMLNKVFDKVVLEKAGIKPTNRPHDMAMEDWIRLLNIA